MGRLIDADDAVRRSREPSIYDLTDVPDFLAECPTVDAEPVRHGKWITLSSPDEHGDIHVKCSICGYTDMQNTNTTVPYCWHCGAKMNGGTQ